MAITYVNDLRLSEMGTGDNSGTWGTVTNTNLELIGEALGFGTEAITTNADTHASTIADGSTDPVRAMYVKYTGTLDSACTITIGPNTVNKFYYIENATSGSQNIIISQGSGANVTIPAGDVKAVYLDGAGSGAAVTDAFASLNVVDLKVQDDLTVTDDVSIGGLATIGETLAVTGVLTTTAATVFNGGFAANDGSTITTADNTAQLTLISTDADAGSGPQLDFYRNSASPADNDQTGRIIFAAENDADEKTEYTRILTYMPDVSNGSEDAAIQYYLLKDGTSIQRLEHNPTETVFNQDSADVDFRVESDGDEYALFVEGDTNRVSIGSNDPPMKLTVRNGSVNTDVAKFTGDGTGGGLTISTASTTRDDDTVILKASDAFGEIALKSDNTEVMRINTGKQLVIATGSDLITNSASGVSNIRFGNDAGDSIVASNAGVNNICIGTSAGTALDSGDSNIAIGHNALKTEDDHANNIAIGYAALENQDAGADGYNVAVGYNAGNDITDGVRNVIIGGIAGDQATTIDDCVIIGYNAGGNATMTGHDNVLIGKDAGQEVSSGYLNVMVGIDAGTATTDGFQNTFIGENAGFTNTGGDTNTFIGSDAGYLCNGNKNTFIGKNSGESVLTGDKNSILGSFNGNEGSLDIRNLDNNIVLSDGDGNPRLLITSGGNITNNVGNVSSFSRQNAGFTARNGDAFNISRNNGTPLEINRISADGALVQFFQDDSNEGNISVSGSTVTYNGFSGTHESSGVPTNTAIGTVVSTIDELDTYVSGPKSGQTRADHAKIKVSDSEGDKRIYGVISGYTEDDNKPIVASVGIGSVKVTGACAGGDLLESNGDGTAKVQSDDIIRSKTIGKVTIANSNTGVKLVSCVLYCG